MGCCIPQFAGESVRTFLCIEIPNSHITEIAHWIDEHKALTDEIRWVKPETIHLTLKFCGERPQELVDILIERLNSYKSIGALHLSLLGIGGFPKIEKPRVVWTAVGGDTEKLVSVAQELNKLAVSCGMERGKSAFTPHVTLGRRNAFGALPSAVIENFLAEQPKLPQWTATEFILMRSRLLPTGAEYTPLARYKI